MLYAVHLLQFIRNLETTLKMYHYFYKSLYIFNEVGNTELVKDFFQAKISHY